MSKTYPSQAGETEALHDLQALWDSIAARTRKAAETLGLLAFRRLDRHRAERLDTLLRADLPALRARLHHELAARDPR